MPTRSKHPTLLVGLIFLITTFKQVTLAANHAALLSEANDQGFRDWLVGHRRHLHRYPELFYKEEQTSLYIRGVLKELNVSYKHPFGVTGISATIGSGQPVIALRADMDALPVHEEEVAGYSSENAGVMHACGHDAHMTMLLGAARLLQAHAAELQGTVVLMFQPAEEAMGGATKMIAEGALQGAQAVAGIHVFPALPPGVVGTRAGTIMAASDRFVINILGRGGHAAMPHLTADPVVAAASLVLALQTLVSRELSPTAGGVVTVSRFNTGPGASNVIPDSVELQGTVRALTDDTFTFLHTRMEEVVQLAAATHRCNSTIMWSPVPYGATINDATLAGLVADVAEQLVGADRVRLLAEPSMAAEDFSFYGREVPAVFSFLGIGDANLGTDASLHNPKFQMDDRQLPLGAALHAATALTYLQSAAAKQTVINVDSRQHSEL